jgi:uncharacterized oxidoreductase
MSQIIHAKNLETKVFQLFKALGCSDLEASKISSNLVMANLSGHDSHGVGMAPRYIDAVLEGNLNINAHIDVKVDSGVLLGIEGNQGFGQVIGEESMQRAFTKVQEHGACIMSLASSHHLGRIGHFAEMAIERGFVSIHFVSVKSRAVVAPFGGGDGRFGTNPFCVGIPTGFNHQDEPFVLDFATSRVAQGKMRVAHNEGRQIPLGTLIDEAGLPTTDPRVVVSPNADGKLGALLTFGEHKGFGLAVACELLGGALSGGGTWHTTHDGRRAVLNSMLTIIIDPKRLSTGNSFLSETQEFIDWLRLSPDAPNSEGVQIAGEPERFTRQARLANGIEIDQATWKELVLAGEKLGITF